MYKKINKKCTLYIVTKLNKNSKKFLKNIFILLSRNYGIRIEKRVQRSNKNISNGKQGTQSYVQNHLWANNQSCVKSLRYKGIQEDPCIPREIKYIKASTVDCNRKE